MSRILATPKPGLEWNTISPMRFANSGEFRFRRSCKSSAAEITRHCQALSRTIQQAAIGVVLIHRSARDREGQNGIVSERDGADVEHRLRRRFMADIARVLIHRSFGNDVGM